MASTPGRVRDTWVSTGDAWVLVWVKIAPEVVKVKKRGWVRDGSFLSRVWKKSSDPIPRPHQTCSCTKKKWRKLSSQWPSKLMNNNGFQIPKTCVFSRESQVFDGLGVPCSVAECPSNRVTVFQQPVSSSLRLVPYRPGTEHVSAACLRPRYVAVTHHGREAEVLRQLVLNERGAGRDNASGRKNRSPAVTALCKAGPKGIISHG